MTDQEIRMVEILKDLKKKYSAIGIKAEFEAEGAKLTELMRLKDIVSQAGLNLTIKVGGAESIRDLHDSRLVGVSGIMAPMIESSFAFRKYMLAIKRVYPNENERKRISYYVNIETIVGYHNLDEILDLEQITDLSGIVLGRSDMANSLGLSKEDTNSEELYNKALGIITKIKGKNLKFIIGGNIDANSLQFLKSMPKNSLFAFETRKVIFKCPKALTDNVEGIKKAIEFEILWLESKQQYYLELSTEDNDRIASLRRKIL